MSISGGSPRSVGDEALEQQLVLDRIDRGDAEQEADQRIGRDSRALAEDIWLRAYSTIASTVRK
jgi:hypothetical protein